MNKILSLNVEIERVSLQEKNLRDELARKESELNPNLMLYKPFPLLFSDFRFQFASLCTTNFWGF